MSRPLACLAIAVPGALGESLDALRHELDPSHRHMPAHITLIPPFDPGDAAAVLDGLRAIAAAHEPFAVGLGGAGTFAPRSRVVYVGVRDGEDHLRRLQEDCAGVEGVPAPTRSFTPHVTLASRCDDEVLELAARKAAEIEGEFDVDTLTWFERGTGAWEVSSVIPIGRRPAPAVSEALERLGIPYRVIVHTEPVESLEQAAAARGVDLLDVVKTLVVRRGADDYVLVLVPGGRSLSWPKLRAVLGVARASMPPPEEALAATGFERGTIGPFGTLRPWPVIADARIAGRTEVTLGSGARDVAIGVPSDRFLADVGATVADVTEAVGVVE